MKAMAQTPQTPPATARTAAASHTDVQRPDSIAPSDSIAEADSITAVSYGIVLETPHREPATVARVDGGQSWILLGLFAIFAVICLRVRSSKKYISALMRDLTEVRERHNAFDDTVRETSLLILLNIFWSCCAGILLYMLLRHITGPQLPYNSFSLRPDPTLCILICTGVALLYTMVMTAAYTVVGNVFSDRLHSRMWVKGFAAQQGLSTMLLFPLALLAYCYPEAGYEWLIAAGITFIAGKFIFICKGFRIFFARFSSWVLFLYYLCSLEIVPLILTCLIALEFCSV